MTGPGGRSAALVPYPVKFQPMTLEPIPEPGGDPVLQGLDFRIDEYHHRITLYPTGEDSVAVVGWEVGSIERLEEMLAVAKMAISAP